MNRGWVSGARSWVRLCVAALSALLLTAHGSTAASASEPIPGFPVIGSATVSAGPRILTFAPGGDVVYVAGDSRSVAAVDAQSLEVKRQVTLGSGPGAIMSMGSPRWFDGVVVFGFLERGFIYFLDRSTLDVVRVMPSDPLFAMAVHPTLPRLYLITQSDKSKIQVVDAETAEVIGSIPRGGSSGTFPRLEVSADGTEVSWDQGDRRFFASTESLSVVRSEQIEATSSQLARPITTPDGRYQVSLSPGRMLVRDSRFPKRRLESQVPLGLTALQLGPTGDSMWGVSASDNALLKFDLAPARPGRLVSVAEGVPGGATVSWGSRGGPWVPGAARVTAVASPGGRSCSSEGSACTIAGLDRDKRYSIRVWAENVAGRGPVARTSVRVPDVKPPRRPVVPQPEGKPEQEIS